jgi:hypothetical protein
MKTTTLTTRQYMDNLVRSIEQCELACPELAEVTISPDETELILGMKKLADKAGQSIPGKFAWKHYYKNDIVWVVFKREKEEIMAYINEGRPDWIKEPKPPVRLTWSNMSVPVHMRPIFAKLINEFKSVEVFPDEVIGDIRRQLAAIKAND